MNSEGTDDSNEGEKRSQNAFRVYLMVLFLKVFTLQPPPLRLQARLRALVLLRRRRLLPRLLRRRRLGRRRLEGQIRALGRRSLKNLKPS